MFPLVILVLSLVAAVVALVNVTPGSAGIVWVGLAIWLAVVAGYIQSHGQEAGDRPPRSKGNSPGSGPTPMR